MVTAKKYLKQFMASVIASTGNRALFRVRWQLAVLFCISIFIIITGYYFLRHLLELGISAQNVHPALTKTIEQHLWMAQITFVFPLS